MKRRESLTLLERLYIVEVVKGLVQTTSHFLTHFSTFMLQTVGLARIRNLGPLLNIRIKLDLMLRDIEVDID
jgi:hypothetical protein